MQLRPLTESDDALLSALEEQDDVWEFIGTLPLPDTEHTHHMFAVTEGQTSLGVAGLVRSQALDGNDFELICAMRSEAQLHGFAKQACNLVLAWAFGTTKLDRAPSLLSSMQARSEEHTSELQSPCNLVCRLLLEKKKKKITNPSI